MRNNLDGPEIRGEQVVGAFQRWRGIWPETKPVIAAPRS